ncbi:MAG TPA: MBOAT family O-acyltransferase, partial [Planctomycetota bacterium]|nr:MBOAT family O-acyltransferase [Planctomycetota bacterium]
MTQWLLAGVLLTPLIHGLERQWLHSVAARQGLVLTLSLLIGFLICGLWIGVLAAAATVIWLVACGFHRPHANKSSALNPIWVVVALAAAALGSSRSEWFIQQWSAIQMSALNVSPLMMLVGTSYFLLRALSLCFDARKGKLSARPELLSTLNFLLFFPTLISGPLDRYERFRKDMLEPKAVDAKAWDEALWRGVLGLFKKFVLANTLALYALPAYLNDLGTLSAAQAWIGFYLWALVIYLDFSGYCDVGISLGRLMGFTVPENFRSPYFARNITEFWRRWHISLS